MMQIHGTWRKPDATGHLRDDDNGGKDYTNLTVETKLDLANATAAVRIFLTASGIVVDADRLLQFRWERVQTMHMSQSDWWGLMLVQAATLR
jgi:hypothetical protein